MLRYTQFVIIIFYSFLFFSCNENKIIEPQNENIVLGKKNIPENLIIVNKSQIKSTIKKSSVKDFYWDSDFGTPLNQIDDVGTFIEFGFTFNFYGINYNGVWVNSNGNVTFNSENQEWSSPDIPDLDKIIIAPLYGDFDPLKGGDVFVKKIGTGNKQRVVITWADIPEYAPSDNSNTFQLILFKTRNIILFGYNGLGTDGVNWAYSDPSVDGNMDVGISSGTGQFINSASGPDILNLDYSNIVYYVDKKGNYIEKKFPTQAYLKSLDIL